MYIKKADDCGALLTIGSHPFISEASAVSIDQGPRGHGPKTETHLRVTTVSTLHLPIDQGNHFRMVSSQVAVPATVVQKTSGSVRKTPLTVWLRDRNIF